MTDKLALYKADWMRVLADAGLGAAAITQAIELAELNGLFDTVKAAIFEASILEPDEIPPDAEHPVNYRKAFR